MLRIMLAEQAISVTTVICALSRGDECGKAEGLQAPGRFVVVRTRRRMGGQRAPSKAHTDQRRQPSERRPVNHAEDSITKA